MRGAGKAFLCHRRRERRPDGKGGVAVDEGCPPGGAERKNPRPQRGSARGHGDALQHLCAPQRRGGQGGSRGAHSRGLRLFARGRAFAGVKTGVRSHGCAGSGKITAGHPHGIGAQRDLLRRGQPALLPVRGFHDPGARLHGLRRQRTDGARSLLRQISHRTGRNAAHGHGPRGQGAFGRGGAAISPPLRAWMSSPRWTQPFSA